MRTRSWELAAVAVALATLPLACGGKAQGQGSSPGDSGVLDVTTVDASEPSPPVDSGTTTVSDSGPTTPVDSGFDAGLPPGTVGPTGTQLFASGTVRLEGVTSDDFAIYADDTSNTAYAVPIAGGTPRIIGPVDPTGYVATYGAVAVIMSSTGSTLSVWTSANGLKSLSTSSSYEVAISKDNSLAAFIDGLDTSTGLGNVVVMGTDGTGRHTVLTNVQASTSDVCYPTLAFADSVLITSSCGPAAADAGYATATISTFSGPAWAPVTVATGVYPGANLSPSFEQVLVLGPAGLELYPIAGGSPTMVDPLGSSAAVFTSDSKTVVYPAYDSATEVDAGGTVKRAAVGATPNPESLAPGLFQALFTVSPSNGWALGYQNYDMTNYNTDLYLLSTSAPGPARALAATESVFYGAAFFTADSKYVTYVSQSPSGLTYPLSVAPVAGGAPTVLAASSYNAAPTSGSKLVFNANFQPNQAVGAGTADIDAVDLSQTAPAATLVTQANASFFLTSDKQHIVYSWSYAPGPLGGVWVMAAP
jgi:hypothetical protein